MMAKPASMVLIGVDALREWIARTDIKTERLYVASDFMIGLINEIAATEFPYNATVKALACSRLGIPCKDPHLEGDNMSGVVYASQNHRRYLQQVAAGHAPLTQAMIDEAGEGGEIEFEGHNILCQKTVNAMKVRRVDGWLYLMPPRSRNKHFPPQGQPAKIIKYGKRKAELV